jgi:hypothetical protein
MSSQTTTWTRQGLLPWTRLPSAWIESRGLLNFHWKPNGADHLAALMALLVIAHHANKDTGIARLTWNDLGQCTGVSRAKLAAGLSSLESRRLVEREPNGRSTFLLRDFGDGHVWAKLPAKPLYSDSGVRAFAKFTLRTRTELDALKLYLLFAARRDVKQNITMLSYPMIEEYSGVQHHNIKPALSLLIVQGLIIVDSRPSETNQYGIANGYRLASLQAYQHPGTTGRGFDNGITGDRSLER